MAEQKGSDMLLKIDTAVSGGPTYTTVGGIQSKGLKINEESVDVTTQDATDKFRRLLAGAGIRKVSLSGSGILSGGTGQLAAHTSIMEGTIKDWEVIVPGWGSYTGKFQVTSFDIKGPHDKAVDFDISLESAGQITFAAD